MRAIILLSLLTPTLAAQADAQATVTELPRSSAGAAGQRLTRNQVGANVAPLGRVDNRLKNRVLSRLQTRLDRDHSASSNPADQISAATEASQAPNGR